MNERRDTLDSWLAAARADLARQEPPQWIESALAARQAERTLVRHLRERQAPRPALRTGRKRIWWLGLPAGVAALLAVGTGLTFLAGSQAPASPTAAAFMALTPLETIAAEPRPVVIASEVPRAQLAAFGLPVDPARADLPVRAEFLVSQRGALLAVRFSPE
jgi:hypothetical protein